MENSGIDNYTWKEILTIFFKQRSRHYEKEGRYFISRVTYKDIGKRFVSVLIDCSVMFFPIYLWLIVVLLIFSDILPASFLPIVQIIELGLMIVSLLFIYPLMVVKMNGESLGRYMCNFKIVRRDGHEAGGKVLYLREAIGKGLPVFVLSILFGAIGVFIWPAVNLLVMLIDPNHRSLIDFFLGTRPVVLLEVPANAKIKQVKEAIKQPDTLLKKSANKVDLHMHTTFSDDGEFNVEEIFQLAKRRGVETISITDHNSAKANVIAERMSKLYDIRYIPGIEIDCVYHGRNMHMLGYYIDYKSEMFAKIENQNLKRERDASMKRVMNFEEYTGMKIDVDALLANNRFQTIAGEQIAEQAMNNPKYRNNPLFDPYLRGDRSDMPYVNFYWDYFSQGKPCYVPIQYPDVKVIMQMIKVTGGLSVIAHPYCNFKDDISVVDDLLELGADGVEVFSSYHTNRQMSELLQIARRHDAFITAGSDFHGKVKPKIRIGDTGCPADGEKILNRFLQYKEK